MDQTKTVNPWVQAQETKEGFDLLRVAQVVIMGFGVYYLLKILGSKIIDLAPKFLPGPENNFPSV